MRAILKDTHISIHHKKNYTQISKKIQEYLKTDLTFWIVQNFELLNNYND